MEVCRSIVYPHQNTKKNIKLIRKDLGRKKVISLLYIDQPTVFLFFLVSLWKLGLIYPLLLLSRLYLLLLVFRFCFGNRIMSQKKSPKTKSKSIRCQKTKTIALVVPLPSIFGIPIIVVVVSC